MVLLILPLIVGIYVWRLFNRLAKMKNNVETSFSQLGTELLRRHDLIPSLVETVRGYAAHENETLEAVIRARASAVSASSTEIGTENVLTNALGRLIALKESYPNLKADQSFMNLQKELSEIENRLNLSRRIFNETVNDYNKAQQTFPAVLVAGRLGHRKAELFQAPAGSDARPDFSF